MLESSPSKVAWDRSGSQRTRRYLCRVRPNGKGFYFFNLTSDLLLLLHQQFVRSARDRVLHHFKLVLHQVQSIHALLKSLRQLRE